MNFRNSKNNKGQVKTSLKQTDWRSQMSTDNFLTSACRYCRYYAPEGRRGGACQRLGVPVQANWKACALASPPFAPEWSNLDDIARLEDCLSIEETPVVAQTATAAQANLV